MLSDEEHAIDAVDWGWMPPFVVERPVSPLGPLGHPVPPLVTPDRRFVAFVEDPRVQNLRDAADAGDAV